GAAIHDIHGIPAATTPIADPSALESVPGGPGGDRSDPYSLRITAALDKIVVGLPAASRQFGEQLLAVALAVAEQVAAGALDAGQGVLELLMNRCQCCWGHGGGLLMPDRPPPGTVGEPFQTG